MAKEHEKNQTHVHQLYDALIKTTDKNQWLKTTINIYYPYQKKESVMGFYIKIISSACNILSTTLWKFTELTQPPLICGCITSVILCYYSIHWSIVQSHFVQQLNFDGTLKYFLVRYLAPSLLCWDPITLYFHFNHELTQLKNRA